MKEKVDLVRGWLRKALSDMQAMDASNDVGALDAACFHAQQAAEKLLKAYLIHHDIEFPYTHNLLTLLQLAENTDQNFKGLQQAAEILTPYAVELRYDDEFWPGPEVAQEACNLANNVSEFILARMPSFLAD